MKTLLVLIVGIAIGVFGVYYYQQRLATGAPITQRGSSSAQDSADAAMAKTRAAASDFSEALAAKMQAWHLSPEDIRADLARSGQVARENTARLREKAVDARIVAMIKAKFVLDRDLSANAITVESTDGDVTLGGTVPAENLIGKAVALAMDTDGVHHVTARLTVQKPAPQG